MSPQERWILRDAAAMLEHEAGLIRKSHTLAPHTEWPNDEQIARSEHDKLLKRAAELRAMADRPR